MELEIPDRIIMLLKQRVARQKLSPEELQELSTWAALHPSFQQVLAHFSDPQQTAKGFAAYYHLLRSQTKERQHEPDIAPLSDTPVLRRIPFYRRSWPWLSAAAVMVCIGSYLYFSLATSTNHKGVVPDASTAAVLPARERATLTLSDQRTIDLTDAATGMVAQEAGASVIKTSEGELQYEREAVGAVAGMHKISTPRGGVYHLTLSDGTRVWLNTASDLSFPPSFQGKERKVFLNGEGYFEVSKQGTPFVVVTSQGDIHVLGTHFDTKVYSGEPMTTTLIEGAVQVQAGSIARLLPGQQAIVKGANIEQKKNINTAVSTSWMHGLFAFDNASLQEVALELGRWYDVEFVFAADAHSTAMLKGDFSRDLPLKDALEQIEALTDIHFVLQGRKVNVVKP